MYIFIVLIQLRLELGNNKEVFITYESIPQLRGIQNHLAFILYEALQMYYLILFNVKLRQPTP